MRAALPYIVEIAGFALLVWGTFDLFGRGAALLVAGCLLVVSALALQLADRTTA